MNYAKAINTTNQNNNSASSSRLPAGWTIFNTFDRTVKKPELKAENEDNEQQPYYLDEYESYCFSSAIEDIYNRRLAESMKHYQETGDFDIFAQEAQRNAAYLAKYPDDEDDDDYEYYENE